MDTVIRFQQRMFVLADERMEQVLQLATKAAHAQVPVLICGESGTGKELIARWIHERSSRQRGPFVAVNCAALPEGLLEAELFGYEKGAFTGAIAQRIGKFERASGGTLLLDEVSEVPMHLQAKLLRVLQENEIDRLGAKNTIPIDTRVIATTNRDPFQSIQEGVFRSDLFYRLNVLRIVCPPLRGRMDAIRQLATTFLSEFSPEKKITVEAMTALTQHPWHGNIRELKNTIERAAVLTETEKIEVKDLELQPMQWVNGKAELCSLAEVEQSHILTTLDEVEGNRTEAAKRLQISVRTLRNKLSQYGVSRIRRAS